MKAKFLLPVTMAALAVACHSPNTPPSPNVENPDSARQDKTMVHAEIDTTEETTFRQHEDSLIKANREEIARLKGMARNGKRAAKDEYNKQLDTLDQENSRMETRLHKLGRQTKSDWESFKY